ncbi:NRAMP family metal ion transporter [Candidatus Hydrogenisulfobacillus filiaventi]|uniref:NRAMP family metal ion transporter n=1 Tax=Candidatus Hydrogenisulfobacillus filiaventi TaxID=2707344 RepID=A0A6F8ZD47_9FIRM|nr:divalent metal cation transporter [Bacillota bacterium]CAB1127675.1 NRAMP family metal ion transporter [Candidatus Hydrogenisulfobacillus filiaventi]
MAEEVERLHPGSLTAAPAGARRRAWLRYGLAFGPGIMVMLADTDVGSVVTAAQSGVQWGYTMILPQLLLIPILYLVQEVTVRLGMVTGRGHGELIRERFGFGWALLSVSTLFLSAVGALVTEFSGIAGVGSLWGIPPWASVGAATLGLIALGLSGRYQRVEGIGIALGSLELLFLAAAWQARPDGARLLHGLTTLPLGQPGYVWLLAANVGAVIMPWMVFYQQGAVIDKGWGPRHLRAARVDTAVGAVLTQLLMIAVVLLTAATLGHGRTGGASLQSIPEIADALIPFVGAGAAKVLFGAATLGAGFVAALVVSIAGAWGMGEAFGFKHSLNHRLREAPLFYGLYTLAHLAGAVLVIASIDLVQLTVDVEVMNAILLPVVLGFLLALEARALPPAYRMRGAYRWTVWSLAGLVMAFGVYMAFAAV